LSKSLSYFSGITQRTLSAFHKAGIDASLLDEIDNIKSQIVLSKPLVLKDAVLIEHNKYIRYFEGGYSDVVDFENVFRDVYKSSESEVSELTQFLDGEISPISKMGVSMKLNTINVDRKKIEKPTECIFFF
jgi:N-acetylneuraminic acid mutarotase